MDKPLNNGRGHSDDSHGRAIVITHEDTARVFTDGVDVTDEDSLNQVSKHRVFHEKKVDILINNAGYFYSSEEVLLQETAEADKK